jgi:hypothetical protein
MRSHGARGLTGLVIALEQRAARAVTRVDRCALWWLASRTTLPRELVVALLEWSARRVGAKVEITDAGGV